MTTKYKVTRPDTTVKYKDKEYNTDDHLTANSEDEKIKSLVENKFIEEVKEDEQTTTK